MARDGFLPRGHFLAASGLPQIQQVTDPNNAPAPQDDHLPEGVAFPIGDSFGNQWVTSPGGAHPKAGQGVRAGAASDRPSPDASRMHGHADAMHGRKPSHKDDYKDGKIQHGRYLGGWNETAGLIHGLVGRAPMSLEEYSAATGRGDLHSQYLASYANGRQMNSKPSALYQGTASRRVQADAWTQPRQTTDSFNQPYNSAATTPPMHQGGGDYAAGVAAGRSDRAAGQRPAFADNSSGVSPYVKGYAEGYAAAPSPSAPQDVPYSMGGDSGQSVNAGEAQRAFQVSQGSKTAKLRRVSAAFAPDSLLNDAEFRKGYLFASKWKPGARLVSQGSAKFEAGLYAGVTDRPEIQGAWTFAHMKTAARHPDLRRRIDLHHSFTRKWAARSGLRTTAAYLRREAGTTTDLITDGPGTSPDPMGATPLNGPGAPPPMGGASDPAAPGGAPPYQGAPPLPGGPVVPDDVMGRPQQAPQPSGPFTQTFSGTHPENIDLAPAAPNAAARPGYSNKDAYRGDPSGDRVAALNPRLAQFRARVQASLRAAG